MRRWLNLDIQTALCLMNIPFALCLTREEYQTRGALAAPGRVDPDAAGRAHRRRARSCAGGPATIVVRVDSGMDVPRAVYEHAVICEYAHAHLKRLAAETDALERASTKAALA